jgi:hypothetical protein
MMARGGFFKKIFKGVKNVVKAVSRVPVLGAVAKAAVGSLPVVGQVVTAVNAFKGKTAQGVAATPVGGVQSPGQVLNATVNRSSGRRRRPKVAKRAKRGRAKRAKRSGGGTAKQRAARARFAAAARKGKIRKGQRL